MAWHDAKCATLDLDWEDGRPGCRTCQRRAPELTPFHPISPPAPPPDTSRSELVCTWPPKLFSRPRGEDDEDSKLLAIVCANIDEWTSSTTSEKSQTSVRRIQEQPLEDNDSVTSFRRIYSHLPDAGSIRLLRLHGSKTTDDPVHCTLEIHRLHNPCRPVFEAFSYTWADFHNDSSLCKTIFLGPHYDTLPVTINCLAALRHFRTAADRLVWVDAVCINQLDIKERDHQVSLMRDIYTCAARVLMYVGNTDHEIERTIGPREDNDRLVESRPESPTVDARALLEMPYFSRIWVIQEVLLNRTASVTFNERTVHWKDISSKVKSNSSNRRAKYSGNWVEHFSNRGSDRSLFAMLVATKNCLSSDLRDRVYGLMGLVTEEERENLPIDYSISVQQLYTGLAMHWLTDMERHGQRMPYDVQLQPTPSEVLKLALLPKITPFLPSWAPDWAPQLHTDASRECAPAVPVTFQFDITCVERPSSGLGWPKKSNRMLSRWTLNDISWEQYLPEDLAKKEWQIRLYNGDSTTSSWHELAEDLRWRPGRSVTPSPQSGALVLDAVHILSISMGEVGLTDVHGKLLHGLQLTNTGRLGPADSSLQQHDIHVHYLPAWNVAVASKEAGRFSL